MAHIKTTDLLVTCYLFVSCLSCLWFLKILRKVVNYLNLFQRFHIKDFAVEVLTDLSSTFDFLNHKILVAKLHIYGFGEEFSML